MHDIHADTGNRLSDAILDEFDTVLVHMLHDRDASEAWEKLAAHNRTRMVFDCDDAMWAPDWKPFKNAYDKSALDRLFRNIALAHVITTPSSRIAEDLSRFNPNVYVVPNTVPESLTKRTMRHRPRPVIGYQGSPSHVTDIDTGFRQDLGRFMAENRQWNLRIWGGDPSDESMDGRISVVPWQPTMAEYYKTLSMDVGLGPLAPTYFNECKSSLRAVEYMALGIVPVLTDLRPYVGWVEHGVNGYLVRPGESWYGPLSLLARFPEVHREWSLNARDAAAAWTTEANAWRWVEAWNSV